MNDVVDLFPLILVMIVFTNRYFLGLFLVKSAFTPKRKPLSDAELKDVCIIVPMFNEGRTVYGSIKSMSRQDYPRDKLSIIIVDDCSTDDSYSWAVRASQEDPRVTVLRNEKNVGKRIGIAHAVQKATAEFIVSVDSDVELEESAIRILMSEFDDPKIAAVGGRVNVRNANRNWLTKMQTVKYFIGYAFLKNIERAFESVMCLSGCLTAYRRHVLIELEPVLMNRNLLGVAIKYGEDRFLTRQIVKAGYKTRLILEAQCATDAPNTLDKYFSQQLRWRRSNLVDFIGSMSHAWKLHPMVTLHYVALNTLILCYPVYLWYLFFKGTFWSGFLVHLGVLTILAMVYWFQSQKVVESRKVHPIHFLWMGLIMPVTYMVLSVLALFTLDSGSWETRKG